MEIKAKVKFIRMSPRKVRLVVDVVRGLSIQKALIQLQFINKAAALPVDKLIRSAIANAEHNFKLKADDLFIKSISVDGGPTIHRWRPRAFGRSAPIRKRTSHINLILDEIEKKDTVDKKVKKTKKTENKKENKTVKVSKSKTDSLKKVK